MVKSTVPLDYMRPFPGNWHDLFFKAHFNTPAEVRSLMRIALVPEVLELFDLRTVSIKSSSLLDTENLTEYVPDLVVEVKTKQDCQIEIYLVIEHKSGKDRKLMHQLHHYVAGLNRDHARYVIPITIYHGQSAWDGEKLYSAFHYSNVPEVLVRHCSLVQMDLGTLFIDLSDEEVQALFEVLPLKEALVLEVLSKVWEADAEMYAKWIMRIKHLKKSLRRSFSKSLHEYLYRTRPFVKISDVKKLVRQATDPGDEIMREIMTDWNGFQPDSAAEARAFGQQEGREEGLVEGHEKGLVEGHEKGLVEGHEKGLVEGREEVREKIRRIAQRMLRAGISDQDIETITQLNKDEITKLRNGGA